MFSATGNSIFKFESKSESVLIRYGQSKSNSKAIHKSASVDWGTVTVGWRVRNGEYAGRLQRDYVAASPSNRRRGVDGHRKTSQNRDNSDAQKLGAQNDLYWRPDPSYYRRRSTV